MKSIAAFDWCCIVNPNSGGSRSRQAKRLISLCEKSNIPVVYTDSLAALYNWVEGQIVKGRRHFIFAGGDGSIHQAIHAVYQCAVPLEEVRLAFLPCGTGNDWATFHDLERKAGVFWEKLKAPAYFEVPLCEIDLPNDHHKRLFCNIAGLGFDAFVAGQIAKKGKSSKWIYLQKVVTSLTRYKSRLVSWRDEHGCREEDVFSFHVGIGQASGGGLKILPHAHKDPEKLFVTIVKKDTAWQYLKGLPGLLRGQIAQLPFIVQWATKDIIIEGSATALGIECDGEVLGHAPCSIRLYDQRLNVLDTRRSQ